MQAGQIRQDLICSLSHQKRVDKSPPSIPTKLESCNTSNISQSRRQSGRNPSRRATFSDENLREYLSDMGATHGKGRPLVSLNHSIYLTISSQNYPCRLLHNTIQRHLKPLASPRIHPQIGSILCQGPFCVKPVPIRVASSPRYGITKIGSGQACRCRFARSALKPV